MLQYCPPYRDVITGPTSARHKAGNRHCSRYSWAISAGSRSTWIYIRHRYSHENVHYWYVTLSQNMCMFWSDHLLSARDAEVVRITLRWFPAVENEQSVFSCRVKSEIHMKGWYFSHLSVPSSPWQRSVKWVAGEESCDWTWSWGGGARRNGICSLIGQMRWRECYLYQWSDFFCLHHNLFIVLDKFCISDKPFFLLFFFRIIKLYYK